MTDNKRLDIPAIRARAEKATKPFPSHPGVFGWVRGMMDGYHHSILSGIAGGIIFDAPRTNQGRRDCEFAAAARTDVPDLCAYALELEKQLANCKKVFGKAIAEHQRLGDRYEELDDKHEAAKERIAALLPANEKLAGFWIESMHEAPDADRCRVANGSIDRQYITIGDIRAAREAARRGRKGE